MKKYYNTPCSIYTFWTTENRWSKVQSTIPIYEDIKCAIWGKDKSYWQGFQALQTDLNGYSMVLDSIYPDVSIWDIVIINWISYKVNNHPIPHERSNGIIDNYELFITKTTKNANWI